ncbi:GAF domain-containing protein [Ancylobacter sp. G4_0304]|uniref:GAF domain-containing protein n=1 Tax=Ancylobacter sp. G4_0304 TaxID=3114289 RepID=UPI0039C5F11F
MTNSQEVASRLDAVLSTLLDATNASRTTLRVDVPALGFIVNDPAGEAKRAEVKSLRGETGLNQRALETVKWLERERRPLVQDDLLTAEVPAPAALIEIYGVHAQMLGPLIVDGALQGWVSVHECGASRNWSAADTAALDAAVDSVRSILADTAR